MTAGTNLSDEALAVFAFAIHHQLESGERVSAVVGRDGAGHRADPKAVAELTEKGLLAEEGSRLAFTPAGEDLLQALVEAMRRASGA